MGSSTSLVISYFSKASLVGMVPLAILLIERLYIISVKDVMFWLFKCWLGMDDVIHVYFSCLTPTMI